MMPVGLYVYAAVAIGAAAIGGTTAWTVQNWRYTGQIATIKAAQLEAVNTATREARATESRRYQGIHDAQAIANKRAAAARSDASAARSELDRLRNATASTRGGVPGESAPACAVRADTTSELFDRCAAALVGMGEQADRLNTDRLMLLDAWPR